MNSIKRFLDIFKKIDNFFLEGIKDSTMLHSMRSMVHFQIFGIIYLIVLVIFDKYFTFGRFVLYFSILIVKLFVLKLLNRNQTIVIIITTIDWIVAPYLTLKKVDIALRAAAFLLVVPYGAYLYYISEKFSLIIAIMNLATFIQIKSELQQMFVNSSREFVVASIESYCNGIPVMMVIVWFLWFVHRRRFENILKEYSRALVESQSTNSKLTEANLKYRDTIKLLEEKNQELKESKSNLEEAVKAKDQLLALVS